MTRDSSGRFTSEKPDATAIDKFFSMLERLAARGRLLPAAVFLLVASGAYFAVPGSYTRYVPTIMYSALGGEADLFQETMHLWTFDSTAPDGEKVQHKEIKLKGLNHFTGTYQYREITS